MGERRRSASDGAGPTANEKKRSASDGAGSKAEPKAKPSASEGAGLKSSNNVSAGDGADGKKTLVLATARTKAAPTWAIRLRENRSPNTIAASSKHVVSDSTF